MFAGSKVTRQTFVTAKRSRGTFAGVKGQVATFLSLDACVNEGFPNAHLTLRLLLLAGTSFSEFGVTVSKR